MPIGLTLLLAALWCPVLPPVSGPVARPFAPVGAYGGHWGVDLAVPPGTPVHAAAAGVVTFAGSVAGRSSVTIDHGGMRTSYSYLSRVTVAPGPIAAGAIVGLSGIDRGIAALHLSVRVGDRYVDPERLLGCGLGPPGPGLRLLAGYAGNGSPAGAGPTRWGGTGERSILSGVRRGILGGTFDPPHIAHLVAGEAAFRESALDVVTFLPAGAPWQKVGIGVTASEHRWEMTRLAIAGVAYFEADDREVRRDGWTYTADTLSTFPDDEELVLILGSDAAAGVRTWRRWEEVLERVSVAVMPRPGVDPGEVAAAVGPHHRLATPLLDVSGTSLRAGRRAGSSIRFLVPDAVCAYVEEHGLYV